MLKERIAEEGGNLALIDLDAEGLAATKPSVEGLGVRAWTYACSITDDARVKQVIHQAAEGMGGFDTLVHLPRSRFKARTNVDDLAAALMSGALVNGESKDRMLTSSRLGHRRGS